MGAPIHSGDVLLDRQAAVGQWLLRTPLALALLYQGFNRFLVDGAPALAAAEVIVGVGLFAGALLGGWMTRIAAFGACLLLLGAIFTAHWGQWHPLPSETHPMGGIAFPITLLCIAIYLLIRGNEV
mgnify:CR=1 FL=1